jgi:hypothetical protein
MNCAWCGANADGSDSHGICQDCSDRMKAESAWRQLNKTPSYVETNATAFANESLEETLEYSDNSSLCLV